MYRDRDHEEIDEWRAAIGKAIVSFAEVELATYKCLLHLPRDKIIGTASRQGFSFRVDLITEILESRKKTSAHAAEFICMLKRARNLAEKRNAIAHNPVMLNVFADRQSEALAIRRCITTVRGDQTLDLADVQEFAEEIEFLSADIWLQIGKLAEKEDGQTDGDPRDLG